MIRHSGDFAGKNIILEELAYWLNESDGYMNENSLMAKLAQFLQDRGIALRVSEIIEYFVFVGVLERVEDDICFRYRTFEAFFLARYAIRNTNFIQQLTTRDGILKLSKEYSFVCDLSRQNGLLLSNLEKLIDDLQPAGFSGADPEAFLRVIDTKMANVMDDEIPLIRPQTSELDEIADVRDRYENRFQAQVESELEKKFEREGEDDEVILLRDQGKIPLKFIRQLAFITSWSLWGRAISSLDFVELLIRKPSLKRLLTNWSKNLYQS